MISHFLTNCPVANVLPTNFCQSVLIGGETHEMAFTKNIFWLLQLQAKTHFMHGNKSLRSGSNYHSDPHQAECLNPAMHMFDDHCLTFDIKPSSTLSLVIEARAMIVPVTVSYEDENFNRTQKPGQMRRWTNPSDDWKNWSIDAEAVPCESALESIEVDKVITWSSHFGPQKNRTTLDSFKKKWRTPLDPAFTLDAINRHIAEKAIDHLTLISHQHP